MENRRAFGRMRPLYGVAIVLLAALGAAGLTLHGRWRGAPLDASAFRNTDLNVKYVGAEACRPCHENIAHSFKTTPHALTHHVATPERLAPYFQGKQRLRLSNAAGNYHYEFYERDGRYFLSGRRSRGAEGRRTIEVETLLGSGQRGFTLLSKRDEWKPIAEMAIVYFTDTKSWGFSPDVREDMKDVDAFLYRPLAPTCFRCHDTYFESRHASHRFGREVLGVSCEKCHGPGERHVRERQAEKNAGRRPRRGVDFSIVNPARLSLERQMDVCGECHSRAVEPYDESVWEFEYRPGQTLTDFYERVTSRLGTQHTEVESLRTSDCFKKSAGRLVCQTCHPVHSFAPRSDAHYNRICQGCHNSGAVCPIAQRMAGGLKAANCVDCHMPKRDVVGHAYFRSHYIAVDRADAKRTQPAAPMHDRAFAAP